MNIWVDADACPRPIKEVLYRAAERTRVNVTLIANQYLAHPPSQYIRAVQVPSGFDVADNEIVKRVEANDLVITSDLPLASEALDMGAKVINFRGQNYTLDNIKSQLNMRDFLETMRASGEHTGGPPSFSPADTQKFANALDRLLTKQTHTQQQ